MSKKKNQGKKHKFKYAEPSSTSSMSVSAVDEQISNSANPRPMSAPKSLSSPIVVGARDFSYVISDLRRITIIAVALVVLQLILWYLATYSGLGEMIYRLIKV